MVLKSILVLLVVVAAAAALANLSDLSGYMDSKEKLDER